MFNNVVLDVFIGLIFVFLLYSLLATILQEIISSNLALRGRMLQKALRRMLQDDKYAKRKFGLSFGIANYWTDLLENIIRYFRPFKSPDSLLARFYSHPTIKYLGEGKLFKKPAYLGANVFSKTLIHLLRGPEFDGRSENESVLIKKTLDNNTLRINDETLKHIRMLFADARQDSFVFNQKLEEWFDETMQRTTSWYKKQTQLMLLLIGFFMAMSFNVDSIAITKILIENKDARDQTLKLALDASKEYKPIVDSVKTFVVSTKTFKVRDTVPGQTKDTTITDTIPVSTTRDRFLDSIYDKLQLDAKNLQSILGLGPSAKDSSACLEILKHVPANTKKEVQDAMLEACLKTSKANSPYQKSGWLKFAGWLITALAISLGAPFWFDLLNKVIKLRVAGTKPPEEAASTTEPKTTTGKVIRG